MKDDEMKTSSIMSIANAVIENNLWRHQNKCQFKNKKETHADSTKTKKK